MTIIIGIVIFMLGAFTGIILTSIMASASRDSFERDYLEKFRDADKESKV